MNDFHGGGVTVNSNTYPSGVNLTLPNGIIQISTITPQTFGGYIRHFELWQKIDRTQAVVASYNSTAWSHNLDGSYTYKAKFNRQFTVAITNSQSFEGLVGGTYNVEYGSPVLSWSGSFIEHISTPIHVEALPPSSDWDFVRWSDGSEQNPRDFIPGDHITIFAQYKQHLASSSAAATGATNQRKLLHMYGSYPRPNAFHLAYQSGGDRLVHAINQRRHHLVE